MSAEVKIKPVPVIDESMWSVCYRTNKPTIEDYDEAIQELELAKVDLRWKRDGFALLCCFVCEDTGHTAESCHHNPLLLAREWAKATGIWQCWHCGFIATNDQEATDHFGKSEDEVAKCLVSAAVEAAVKAERERCAEIAEGRSKGFDYQKALAEHDDMAYGANTSRSEIALAIRGEA